MITLTKQLNKKGRGLNNYPGVRIFTRTGGRPNHFITPTKLFHDKYFSFACTETLEHFNKHRWPQYNSLRNYFSRAPTDPTFQGVKPTTGGTPKLKFPEEAEVNRYGSVFFSHRTKRDAFILNPKSVPMYHNLPNFYKDELEMIPSEEFLYHNQSLEYKPFKRNVDAFPWRSKHPHTEIPSKRPQYDGTWIKRDVYAEEPKAKDLHPIRYTFPAEAHVGLWGGVGILQGWKKARGISSHHSTNFKEWRPYLQNRIFHPELVNFGKPLEIVVTARTMELIEEAGGFDSYILKTPVCELNSMYGNLLKRDMQFTLHGNWHKSMVCDILKGSYIKKYQNMKRFSNSTYDYEPIQNDSIGSTNPLLDDNETISEIPYNDDEFIEFFNNEYQQSQELQEKVDFMIKSLEAKYEKYKVPFEQIEWIGLPLPLGLEKQYEIELKNKNPRYVGGRPYLEIYDEMVENDNFMEEDF